MYELKVTAGKVLGTCTADPPVRRGDFFTVRDGDITIPDGGFICLWALQNLLPLITPKEREIAEESHDDWMWRVHHAQCPDPNGRVVFRIERVGRLDKDALEKERGARVGREPVRPGSGQCSRPAGAVRNLRSLRVVVEQVKGRCTSRMEPGDFFVLHSGRIYIPAGHHFCLYALHAALPLLPAKQRARTDDDDWLASEDRIICPDPAGNVVMRIEPLGGCEDSHG
jgi:uncharacterized repeat protein (TIGR04076 family)